jgi:hypothetical protein
MIRMDWARGAVCAVLLACAISLGGCLNDPNKAEVPGGALPSESAGIVQAKADLAAPAAGAFASAALGANGG